MEKNLLKAGDLIRFHDWGTGGFLFGVIIPYEDNHYHSKLNIWRQKSIYMLQSHGIDCIKRINTLDDVENYEIYDFLLPDTGITRQNAAELLIGKPRKPA